VSTDRLGRTALGVLDYLDGGKKGDRPELRKALDYCKKNKGAKLIVATMSRLTRDTRFLLTLLDGSVDVVFADLPQVPAGAQAQKRRPVVKGQLLTHAPQQSSRTRRWP
jgi:Resolvase, N terminal domain